MKLKTDNNISNLSLDGEIIFENSNDIKEKSKQLLAEAGFEKVIIDLGEVSFLDSSGVGLLISLFKTSREQQGRLVLAAPPAKVQKVIELTKLDKIMEVYASVEAAENSFQ